MRDRYLLLIFLFSLLPLQFWGQYFTWGNDPASIKWFQIKTHQFQIIFPENYKEQANYTANLLSYFYERVNEDLEAEPRKISVIIHNKSVSSNGFVAPAPDRVELFTTPPQNNNVTPWLEHLCIHELRHVVQVSKLRQGITKIFSYLLGEQALAGAAAMIPMWYLEGDAVLSETKWTPGGRGTLPSFSKEFRAHFLDSLEDYSYDKMLMGSYKNYTPDHYRLGYQMVSYAQNEFGEDIAKDLENFVAKNSFMVFPFPAGMKKLINMYPSSFYKEAFSYYDSLWTSSYDTIELNKEGPLTKKTEEYTSYSSLQYYNDTTILALRKDLSQLPAFVKITPSSEKKVFIPGKMTSEQFSYANQKIVWSEKKPDIRWSNRSYSIIKVLDLKTGNARKLTSKTRFFAPTLTENGKIAAVKISETDSYALVLIDAKSGKVLKEYLSPNHYFIQNPVWNKDNQSVFVIGLAEKGKTVYQFDLLTEEWEQMLPATNCDIQDLSLSGNYLYFHATYSGLDNIYAKDLRTDSVYKITNARYGAMYSDIYNEDHMVYSNYTAKGYQVYQKDLSKKVGAPVDVNNIKDTNAFLHSELPDKEEIVSRKYSMKRYRRWKHIFNFHSWAPFYADYNISRQSISKIAPGVLLLSQNDLSTALSTFGYSYESGQHQFHSQFHYSGWYPKFSIKTNYGGDPGIFKPSSVSRFPQELNSYYDVQLDVSVPLSLQGNKYNVKLIPSLSFDFKRNFYYNSINETYEEGLRLIDYNLFFYGLQRMAYRDIQPRKGFILELNARTSPFNDHLTGNMRTALGQVFLPGFFKDHGIKLTAGYQEQETKTFAFSSYLSYPRGYKDVYDESLFSMKIDYVFPLFYPDWSIGSLFYFKRFKLDLFYDYALAKNNLYYEPLGRSFLIKDEFLSCGAEFTTDFHFARMFFPFNAGVRYSYLPFNKQERIEFIFSVDLYRIYTNFN